jgi:hypothetical protein
MRHAGAAETCIGIVVLLVLAGVAGGILTLQSRYDPAFFTVVLSEGKKAPPQKNPLPAAPPASPAPAYLPESLVPMGNEEVFDSETLSDKIDGKAELYLSSGFVQLTSRRFSKRSDPKSWLELFIYDMGEANNAFSVFSLQKRQGAEKVDLGTNAYRTGDALFLANGSKYIEITTGATDMADDIFALARNMLDAEPPPAADQPAEVALFPQESLDASTISLHMSDVFGFSDLDRVYTAQYKTDSGEVTAFVSKRESEDKASELADGYGRFLVENGGSDLGEIPDVPDSKLFQVFDTYEAVLHKGVFLAGAHEVDKKEDAEQTAARIYKKLDEGAHE